MSEKIIAACGNDCAACPRYCKAPYEKTAEQLRRTAELWYAIGYRDHVVTNEEIACYGCTKENFCRFRIVTCTAEKGISCCAECKDYPCPTLLDGFRVTKTFIPACRAACTEAEFACLQTAFFEKEENLKQKYTEIFK